MPYIGKQPVVGNFVKLDAITTSATDTFPLTNGGAAYTPQSVNQMIVSLNGVIQAPTDAFTLSGSNIVFASALTGSDVIDFILVFGDALDIGVPSDDTVSAIKIKTNAITEAKINDGAVTETKLGTGSVTSDKIGSGAVTTAKLGPAAVTAPTIAPGTITTTQISPSVTLGVPVVSSDPSPITLGSVWFNSTSEELRFGVTEAAVWATQTNAPIIGQQGASAGTGSAFLMTMTYKGPAPSYPGIAAFYDGSSWSTGPGFNPGFGFGSGTGTQSAALVTGGWSPYQSATGEYDGSTWTTGGSLSIGRYANAMGGTQNDGATMAGRGTPGSTINSVEKYNGTSWSTGTALPTVERDYFGGGTSGTSSLWVQRDSTGHFSFDGSTWSTLTSNPSPQIGGAAGNSGPVNDHINVSSNVSPAPTTCNLWNSTSWVSVANYPATFGNGSYGFNSGTNGGIVSGGANSGETDITNIYESSGAIIAKAVTAS